MIGGNVQVSGLMMSVDVRAVVLVNVPIDTQLDTQPPALPSFVPELVWHPVDLATPYRAAARGQPSTQPPADVVKLCPRAVVW